MGRYQQLVAATDNDAYNALVCSELAPEVGHGRVSRVIGSARPGSQRRGRVLTLAGTPIEDQLDRLQAGWTFSRTKITGKFPYADYVARMKATGGDSLAVVRASGDLAVFSVQHRPGVDAGDTVWTFVRSEEHTSELQSLMRISYAVFCLKKQRNYTTQKQDYLAR